MTATVGQTLAVCAERLGADATGVLARLAGVIGDEARDAAAALAGLDETARKHHRARTAADVRVPVPQTLRQVHPSWIEAALAELPGRARSAVAGSVALPVDVWLARHAMAAMPPMPLVAQRPLERVLVRPNADVLAWLSSVGADQLAYALGGPAASHPLLVAAAARIARAPRVGQLGPQRAAIARCRSISLGEGERALVVVASRALASHLSADPVGRLQLSRRLPRDLGILVENELITHASAPLEHAPTWTALLAS